MQSVKALGVLVCVTLGIFFVYQTPWEHLIQARSERKRYLATLEPLIEQARALGATYESLTALCSEGCMPSSPPVSQPARLVGPEVLRASVVERAPIGWPVVWCIDHPARGVSYVNGTPQRSVMWKDETVVPFNSLKEDRCFQTVALVLAVRPDMVLLEFKGLLSNAPLRPPPSEGRRTQ